MIFVAKQYLLGDKSVQLYFEHLASVSLRQFDWMSKGRFSINPFLGLC